MPNDDGFEQEAGDDRLAHAPRLGFAIRTKQALHLWRAPCRIAR